MSPHGTRTRYTAGCHCEACTGAQHAYQSRWAAAAKDSPDLPHGTESGYVNWGCRCLACWTEGWRKNARTRARRKVREGRPLSARESEALAEAGAA